ncbi:MAG: DUF3105 domain-containing protein [Solirubrobacteraceae bacterium]|nr:DUF3105 domain-containing protein [Solirubrobacteraceae bacterium]
MPTDTRPREGAGRIRAIARYGLICVAVGAAVTGLVLAIVGGLERDPQASLPPVRETQLVRAVQHGSCELRRARGGERLRPPVDGPSTAAAAQPRFYAEAPPADRLTAALRAGVIVIHYRPGLDEERLAQLRTLQTVVPRGTIVTPGASGMHYEVAVAAYRRLLGCTRFSDAAIDAIRLFRGRYIGIGPDR